MNEKTLIKIAIICSLVGIFIILLISEFTVIPLIEISEIDKEMLNKEVRIQGTITSIKETPGLYIFKIDRAVNAVLFKEDILQFSINDRVEIQGKVIEYQEEFELQINLIKKI